MREWTCRKQAGWTEGRGAIAAPKSELVELLNLSRAQDRVVEKNLVDVPGEGAVGQHPVPQKHRPAGIVQGAHPEACGHELS